MKKIKDMLNIADKNMQTLKESLIILLNKLTNNRLQLISSNNEIIIYMIIKIRNKNLMLFIK